MEKRSLSRMNIRMREIGWKEADHSRPPASRQQQEQRGLLRLQRYFIG